jgi:NADH:ubiquinone oxidoreductase subunit 2 (subunit N)
MTLFLLALAGLPPTAGFTAKILVLASAVGAGYAWLAVLLIIGTAISIYVYLKIVRLMYARSTAAPAQPGPAQVLPWIGIAVCAIATFVLGFYPFVPSDVVPLVK